MTSRTAFAIPLSLAILSGDAIASDPVDFAADLIGRPYVWGAEGPNSFDCSGLTQYVFQEFGVDLPRRAISQSRAGDPAGRRLQRGDLLFFSSDTRRSLVTHVAIYEGGNTLIEAAKRHGRVRRSSVYDDYLVERFMFARRFSRWSGASAGSSTRREPPPARKGDRRRATLRVLEQIAEALLRRPR